MTLHAKDQSPHIGIIGGGIAGASTALRLAKDGYKVTLLEEGPSLVNGPPMCHLHAGGNFYREISDEDCIELLERSIELMQCYPEAVNKRPTVFAVPQRDNGSPDELLPRLKKIQQAYHELIEEDASKALLGPAENYFLTFSREQLEELSQKPTPEKAITAEDWLTPIAKSLNLDEFKFPFILVQEYGLSLFRIAASVSLKLEALENVRVLTNTTVKDICETTDGWSIFPRETECPHSQKVIKVDFLVNSCGYQSGKIDDMIDQPRQRLLEFKAAYLAQWPDQQGDWPELVIHGKRNTPNGMIQLSPYSHGLFQIHGMCQGVTLFKDGLVSSNEESAQPKLNSDFLDKLKQGWKAEDIQKRTQAAIDHAAKLVPSFANAQVLARPLFGAQQIPGTDVKLRTADVSFVGNNYARTEIIKASSAPSAARAIVEKLRQQGRLPQLKETKPRNNRREHQLPAGQKEIDYKKILTLAKKLAEERGLPLELI